MITVIITSILLLILMVLMTPALWCALGKILKIDDLSFKKALFTFVLLAFIEIILKIIQFGFILININTIIIDLLFLTAGIVISIWIFKIKFNTTIVKSFGLYFSTLFVTVCFTVLLREYVIQAYKIPTGAMLDTIQIGDHILVNKFKYTVKLPLINTSSICQPERDDMVVFVYPVDKRDFIKRVVGVAGDTLEIRNKKVYINDEWEGNKPFEKFNDSHIYPRDIPKESFERTWNDILDKHKQITMDPSIFSDMNINLDNMGELSRFIKGNFRDNFGPVTVPEGHIFVMGDNRDNSHDSRFWGFVPVDEVKGKVFMIYWSWDHEKGRVRWNRIGKSIH